jgi:hypothetical protein
MLGYLSEGFFLPYLCESCPRVVLYTEFYLQPFIKPNHTVQIQEPANHCQTEKMRRERTLSGRKQTLSRRMRTFLLNDHLIIVKCTDVFYSNTFIVYDIGIPYGAENKLFYFILLLFILKRVWQIHKPYPSQVGGGGGGGGWV